MKTKNQKRKSFSQEMEKLEKKKSLKDDIRPFTDVLKKAVVVNKLKTSSR